MHLTYVEFGVVCLRQRGGVFPCGGRGDSACGRDGGVPGLGPGTTARRARRAWGCTPHFLFFSAEKKRKRAVHGPKEKKTLGHEFDRKGQIVPKVRGLA